MAKYVDGFVLVVPKDKVDEYKKMAKMGAESWMKHGALEYMECIGEDLTPKEMGGMKPRSFLEMAKTKKGEEVWFSFIVYKSRLHRDMVNKKVMAYFDKKYADKKDMKMPFDMRRMAYGGFKTVVGY